VVAREIDDVDPEEASVLEEELEQLVRLQVLGDRHDRRHAEAHRPAAHIPVPRVRERDDDALPVCQSLLDMLGAFEPERLHHALVAPAEHVERVEPVPRVEAERLASGRLHQRVGHLPAQHLRLVRGHGSPCLGREAEEEPSGRLIEGTPAPRREDRTEPAQEPVREIRHGLGSPTSSVHVARSSCAT
jgi:hypothetical protein